MYTLFLICLTVADVLLQRRRRRKPRYFSVLFLEFSLILILWRVCSCIRDAYRTTFHTSPFVHFLELEPLPVDRVTLHQVVTDWNETTQRFRSQGIFRSFTPSWIHGFTFLPVVGRSMNRTIEATPLWNRYFENRPWKKKENKIGEKEVLRGGKAKAVNK